MAHRSGLGWIPGMIVGADTSFRTSSFSTYTLRGSHSLLTLQISKTPPYLNSVGNPQNRSTYLHSGTKIGEITLLLFLKLTSESNRVRMSSYGTHLSMVPTLQKMDISILSHTRFRITSLFGGTPSGSSRPLLDKSYFSGAS